MISVIMGICSSRPDNIEQIAKTKNDFDLVIKSSKELEHLLDSQFGATGKGLHEKADSVERYFGKVGEALADGCLLPSSRRPLSAMSLANLASPSFFITCMCRI